MIHYKNKMAIMEKVYRLLADDIFQWFNASGG